MATEDLLTQAANAQAAGTSTAVIQTLALSCHARMLEIADNDKPLAVRHALAGAELLSSLAAVGGVLPDWLAIHEEQCCRYGCIWIHELLLAGDGEARIWVSDALRLLLRMEELHADPVDWAPVMRSSLLTFSLGDGQNQASPGAPAGSDLQGAASCTPLSPPSLYQCVWISDSPLRALTDLGHWLLRQPAEQQNHLPTLVEAACRTRDRELIQKSLLRLNSHPPVEPWRTRHLLELQLASRFDPIAVRRLARVFLAQHHNDLQVWDEACWRTIASLLHTDPDPTIQTRLIHLLHQVAPVECSAFLTSPIDPLAIVQAQPVIAAEDAERAVELYAAAAASLRNPFASWADPEAADQASLDRLIERIRQARGERRGFSMVRLGDGEGLFLCGKRPDLGGAITNGAQIEARLAAQGHRLIDPEHRDLRHQFAEAVAHADWVGIPDLPQCLNGPVDMVSVASGLMLLLSEEQQRALMPRLAVGGCHVHNFLLQAGCYSRDPFDRVNAVIAPSLPANLRGISDLLWLQIPGEAGLRADAFGEEPHYPRVYQKILAAIDQHIQPGDLVVVGAGILGKIYCEAIRRRDGIAVDVGSVIDLCSGHGGTRGEYRMNPWLAHDADGAFTRASLSPLQSSDQR
jgi:hypothetical protein